MLPHSIKTENQIRSQIDTSLICYKNIIYHVVPSPNPKQGIKLSSSKAAMVFPTMDIACS